MNTLWHFKPVALGYHALREPVQGEFFATDAISDPGVALVREGIQNALDAGIEGNPILVRIFLSGEQKAVEPHRISPFLSGAWEHLQAKGNGLRLGAIPTSTSPCQFLVFEDFGTSGLEGDPLQTELPEESTKNNFYHFFRAEGRSDKDALNRGSWGVGKHVFPRSSVISTFYGLTVRQQDHRCLLMGRTILRSHKASSHTYQDGYFGIDDGSLIKPIEDKNLITSFCEVFDLQRGENPGLSVVVPYPDSDINEKSLVKAVLRDYFYPILAGQLEVIVETPHYQHALSANTFIEEVKRIDEELSKELQPLIKLANWARELPKTQLIHLKAVDPYRAWKWSPELIAPETIMQISEAYRKEEYFALRVPVHIRKKEGSGQPQPSYFDIFLVHDSTNQDGKPVFIREGIIISKVNAPRARSVRSMVIVSDPPLAELLRDAENPSHTEWQHDGSNFRGKYTYGKSCLDFVKRSVREIIDILSSSEDELDRTLLADFFSIQIEDEEQDTAKVKQKSTTSKNGKETPPPTPPEPQLPLIRVQKIQGGFAVLPGGRKLALPTHLSIRVAYDRRRGNPLKRYNLADFDLSKLKLHPKPENIDVIERKGNRLLIKILHADFSLHVTGFDERRDLIIVPKVLPQEQE